MNRKNIYWGIFFIALSTLFWEILLTRIFSATMYYHFVFLSISLAMLGFGCSGVVVFLFPNYFAQERCNDQLTLYSSLFSVSIFAAILVFLQVNLSLHASLGSFLRLTILLICIFIPYLFSGLTITLSLKHYSKYITVLYCFDLIGAGFGCILVIALLFMYDGISLVLFNCFVAAVSSMLFARSGSKGTFKQLGRVLAILGLSAFLVNAYAYRFLKITSVLGESEGDVVYEKWNPINRVTVRPGKFGTIDSLKIDYDAVDQSTMIAFDGDVSKVGEINKNIKAFYYQLRKNADILVIGLGGGFDVLAAHLNNHKNITAVEINPTIAEINKTKFSDFSGNLFSRPGIRLFVDDGRNYVRRTQERFDIIQLGNVTSGVGSASGAFTFVENSLYTVEAFKDYFNHLKEDGILWITQIRLTKTAKAYLQPFRVLTGMMSALEELGIKQPEKNLIIIEEKGVAGLPYVCVFMKKTPFASDELQRIDERVQAMGLDYVLHPEKTVKQNILNEYMHATDREAFIRQYPLNVAANTDDKPFFYNFLKPEHYLWKLPENRAIFSTPAFIFKALFSIVSLLAAITIILPLLLFRTVSAGNTHVLNRKNYIIYFACLGLGFMLVEIPLIQKFILFLGQPMYAISTILSSLLIFSGIGSLTAGRFSDSHVSISLGRVISAICLLLVVYVFGMPFIFDSLLGASISIRVMAAITLIFPLGMLLGMALPLGVRLLEKDGVAMIPWVWGINGACSVLGSILAWGIALNFGYNVTLWSGVTVYVLAGIAMATRHFLTSTEPDTHAS